MRKREVPAPSQEKKLANFVSFILFPPVKHRLHAVNTFPGRQIQSHKIVQIEFGDFNNWVTATTLLEIPNKPDFDFRFRPSRSAWGDLSVPVRRFPSAEIMFCLTCQKMAEMLQSKAADICCPAQRRLSCNPSSPPSYWTQKPHAVTLPLSLCLLHPSHPHAGDICLCSLGNQQQPARREPCSNACATKPHFEAILCINTFVSLTSLHQSECTFGVRCVKQGVLASVFSTFTAQTQQNSDLTDYWLI